MRHGHNSPPSSKRGQIYFLCRAASNKSVPIYDQKASRSADQARAQLRFTLMREYSIGKRLLEGYLHQPYSWFLSRHSADLGKPILSVVNQLLDKSELRAQGTFNKLTQANERFRAMAANH
ncbi:hypothetical protein GH984_07230 [Spiribacter sp. C176]|uniref:Uncharacterized protein n=1 Tax=Spiribacter salilacus TaxID=2664894 RepID=A0A6N7QVZ5_9GAMM|nr:hypothetical protein [Spiribacter salilacus]MRH78497.1 hypothetical protein [Spiribacter salilacus]